MISDPVIDTTTTEGVPTGSINKLRKDTASELVIKLNKLNDIVAHEVSSDN